LISNERIPTMKISKQNKVLNPKVYSLIFSLILLFTLGSSGSAGANSLLAPAEPAAIPPVINYQGVVKTDGNLFNGVGYFKFAVVDSPSGDGTKTYWANWNPTPNGTEPPVAVPLEVNQGLFNVRLGETIPSAMNWAINASVFTTDSAYLRVWFSPSNTPGSFEALEPNQRFTSVAYAMHASYAENCPPGTGDPNADTVDGFHASSAPTANALIALDGSAYLNVPRIMDFNNPLYFVDPHQDSNLYKVSGDHFSVNFTEANTGYSVGDSLANDIDYGLRVRDPDWSGVFISGAGDDGIYMSSAAGDGMYIGTTDEFGVNISSPEWSGVYVDTTDATGFYAKNAGWGVYVENATYYGVNARGRTAGGYFADSDTGTYTYVAYGNNGILSNRTKNFFEQHPTDPGKMIVYASLEGGEAGTYYRGTAQLSNGSVTILLPEHFRLVTEDEGLTVQVTPRQECNGLFVAEATTSQIIVKELQGGQSNAQFDFMINGIRTGYLDYEVIRDAIDTSAIEVLSHEQAKTGQ
jgi:hypothetical protein